MKKKNDIPETEGEMLEVARKIAEIEIKTSELKEKRAQLTESLLVAMQARQIKVIPVPDLDRSVEVKHDTSKSPTKTDIVKTFGERGEKFWENLPRSDRFYLSVAKHNGK